VNLEVLINLLVIGGDPSGIGGPSDFGLFDREHNRPPMSCAACLFGSSTSVTDLLWLLIQKVPPLPSAFFEMGKPELQPEAVEEKLKRLTDLSHEWNEV
jgi:hypothetical protein